jgi:hypothetical protein
MQSALDPTGLRVPRTKPTCLLHTWRPHRKRPFTLVLHLHQHQSSRNLHLQYLAKNRSTQHCQSLITQESTIHWSSNHTWSSVDYTDLNKHYPKDPFVLPRIDKVIDSIAGSDLLCFLNCYSGYHQIIIKEED